MLSGNESLNNYSLRVSNNYDLIRSVIVCYFSPHFLRAVFFYTYFCVSYGVSYGFCIYSSSPVKRSCFSFNTLNTLTVPHFHSQNLNQIQWHHNDQFMLKTTTSKIYSCCTTAILRQLIKLLYSEKEGVESKIDELL